jgi:poly(A) polymerase
VTIILDADWMTEPEVLSIMGALLELAPARFVGGCVRDGLLGLPAKDIDACTPAKPEDVERHLRSRGIRVVPTGMRHGTVTAIMDKRHIEITTLRVDAETDGRHATVEFTEDWEADAARRDFTINALSADLDGLVYDYFGGVDDLINGGGIVRFVGDPRKRLEEDWLRLLRYFRFCGRYGSTMDAPSLEACLAGANNLRRISGERIRDELLKMLQPPPDKDSRVIDLFCVMNDGGVLDQALESHGLVHALAGMIDAEGAVGALPDPIRRLAALGSSDNTLRRLKLSRAQEFRIRAMWSPRQGDMLDPRVVKEMVRANGHQITTDAIIFRAMQEANRGDYRSSYELAASWEIPKMPARGQDFLDAGLRGKEISDALAASERLWVSMDYAATHKQCMAAGLEAVRNR